MTTIFEKYYRCPECGAPFSGSTIGSCGHADKWSDLCPDFWGANPRMFFVACCPSCDYCDFADGFEDVVNPAEDFDVVPDPGGDIFDRYKKAYEKAVEKKKPARALADYAVQVAWCRHDMENDEDTPELKKSREAAVYHFEDAFKEKQVNDSERPALHYMMAELSRQNGDFEKATEHLDEIPDDVEISQLAARCRERAEAKDAEPYRLGEKEE